MSTSRSPSNKCNSVTYRKSTNNGDNDRDSSGDSSGDSDNMNEGFNEGYVAKMTRIQDKSGTLVNYGTTIPYTSGLNLGDQLISTSFHVKELAPGLRPDSATYIEFT